MDLKLLTHYQPFNYLLNIHPLQLFQLAQIGLLYDIQPQT
jgi:hypothetical protein